MLTAVEALMKRLKLPINAEKTRVLPDTRDVDDVPRATGLGATTAGRQAGPTSVPARPRRASRASAAA